MGGVYVTFWRMENKLSDGPQLIKDQIAFTGGGINEFRKAFGNPAIIGYHEINEEGEISESATILNEPKPVIGTNSNGSVTSAGAAVQSGESTFDPAMVESAAPIPATQNGAVDATAPMVKITQIPDRIEPKILKDGDSYIKIVGDQVFKLVWRQYEESAAKFDDRVRLVDGENGEKMIERTVWEKLAPHED